MNRQKVVDRLIAMGLTTYEAKVFSALTALGEAGVGKIHEVAEVPRSAIYGTLEKLERRGIVEASTGRPKRFRASSPKVAVSKLESELLGAAKDARDGLEELCRSPQKAASEARIWVIRGRARVQERLWEIIDSARSDLLVAGTAEHMMAFSDIWKKARSKKMKVAFVTAEPDKISSLARYGVVSRPGHNISLDEKRPPSVLFVQADRRTILFASEYEDATSVDDMMAFWTDDASVVRFMNYLTEPLSPGGRAVRTGT